MPNKIRLRIITPEKVVYDNLVDEISALTEDGVVDILPGHTPLITILKTSEFRPRKDGVELPLAVAGGVMKVRSFAERGKGVVSKVTVLTDRSEFAKEIDLQKAKEAYERAKKAMEEKQHMQDIDFARFQSLVEKELNRIRVGEKHKR